MPVWLLNPTFLKYAAIALAVAVLTAGAYFKGRHDVQVKFDTFKAEVVAQAKAQEERNQEIIKQRERLNRGIVDGYKAKLSAANSFINSLQYDPSTGKLSAPGGASGGANGNAVHPIPPPPVIAADCSKETVKLMQLQQWIAEQKGIK